MTVPAPISYDESARKVSIAKDASLTPEYKKELQIELDKLNSFAKEMVACPGSIPPPPNEANRNLAIQVAKLRDSGAMQFKAGKPQEALTQINMALDMALKRPLYEATGAAIADVSEVLAYRCDINMVLGNWAAAYADAELLCLIKPQIPQNYLRKGKCLQTATKYLEAKQAYQSGLMYAAEDKILLGALSEVEAMLA
ncbi:hypothetical protein B0I72DRAFT_135862 [Yarrowia lipolytica]|uniref:YALI0D04895p n=3 Tax=Yarrowia lipolytica TaxID=4952 RepID=Q6CA90_YARLI|nr:YALI0D04895p [Yarrowia lipolytica CLIB122]KAB8284640.1 hypothetical protein BKA91DRAFT_134618 [Yarrowia lipolytica]KAE8170515.1 hypothetical protein BKA90DRAFT_140756 [Yarrowia lipolytica]KAJ8054784.1 hypothetical protein LXG23DRAFT_20982 [Yarrowia lipolytica]QNP98588.1 Translocation protein sec72 [Yarrowia lipolytica]RDW27394.1 hypothetical protein B0I71DRAFT_129126 [Yarrowia lipolytica]|eukprot:XP_502422.1 YALI0D04895p [Yarrowia lipolytica CLIB122]